MHPIIQRLFELIDDDPRSITQIARAAGVDESAVYGWRRGRNRPGLMLIESVFNVLGYEIWLEPTNLDKVA